MNSNRQITTTLKEQRKRDKKNRERGMRDAQRITSLFPLLVLRDKYGFGKKRMEEYLAEFKKVIEAYNEGYLDFEDIVKTLQEEVKIDMSDILEDY